MLEAILLVLLVLVSLLAFIFYRRIVSLENRLSSIVSEKQSQSTRYGLLAEQWLPLSKDFPFNPENFRFIGSPIDGIAFEDDRIVFCEFKFADSKLTERERKIKQLVEEKRVEWKELKVK